MMPLLAFGFVQNRGTELKKIRRFPMPDGGFLPPEYLVVNGP
jgi:hypothetical protein